MISFSASCILSSLRNSQCVRLVCLAHEFANSTGSCRSSFITCVCVCARCYFIVRLNIYASLLLLEYCAGEVWMHSSAPNNYDRVCPPSWWAHRNYGHVMLCQCARIYQILFLDVHACVLKSALRRFVNFTLYCGDLNALTKPLFHSAAEFPPDGFTIFLLIPIIGKILKVHELLLLYFLYKSPKKF